MNYDSFGSVFLVSGCFCIVPWIFNCALKLLQILRMFSDICEVIN